MKRRKTVAMADYSKEEAKQRFEAALRGARITGHKPMSEMKVGKANKTKPSKKASKGTARRP